MSQSRKTPSKHHEPMASSSTSVSAAKSITSTRFKVAVVSLKDAMERYQKERDAERAANALAAASSSSPSPSVTGGGAPVEIPDVYPTFRVPKDHSIPSADLAKMLLAVSKNGEKCFRPGPSISLPFRLEKTFSFTYLNVLHRADTSVYRRGLNAAEDIRPTIRQALVPTIAMVRCNGSVRGQFTRLADRLVCPPASYKPVFPRPDVVAAQMKFDRRAIADVEALCGAESVLGPLNAGSYVLHNLVNGVDAGMPYVLEASGLQVCPKTNGTTRLPVKYWSDVQPKANRVPCKLENEPRLIHDHSFQLAVWLYHNILDHDTKDFVPKLQHLKEVAPELFMGLAKRKDERLARAEFLEKVRTYSVMPNPVKLLFRWALAPYQIALQNYLENDDSNSALGSSPFFGTAARDGEWVLKRANKIRATTKHGGWGKHYSDDKKLYILFPSGELVVWAPDIKSMDLSTTSRVVGPVTELVLRSGYAMGIPYSTQRVNAITWWASMCFNSYLHVGGSAVLEKFNSLMSGIPGTTEMNDAVSEMVDVSIMRVISRFFERRPTATSADMPALAKAICDSVLNTYLYEFKDVSFAEDGSYTGTCHWAVHASPEAYVESDDLIPFLGMVRVHKEKRVLFVPADLSALVAGLVLPKNGDKPSDKLVERIRGVFLTGGWFNPAFNQFLRKLYNDVYDQQVYKEDVDSPYDTDEVCHGEDDIQHLADAYLVGGTVLPTDEVMFDFCTLSRDDFAKKYVGQKLGQAVRAEKLAPAASSSSSSGSVFDFDPLVESARAASALVAGGPTFKASGVGHGNATSSADQEAYAALVLAGKVRREKARALREARRAGQDALREYRMSKGRGRRVAADELDDHEKMIMAKIDAVEAQADEEILKHLKAYEAEESYLRALEKQYDAVDAEDAEDAARDELSAWEKWEARDEVAIHM